MFRNGQPIDFIMVGAFSRNFVGMVNYLILLMLVFITYISPSLVFHLKKLHTSGKMKLVGRQIVFFGIRSIDSDN